MAVQVVLVLLVGLISGYILGRFITRILRLMGVQNVVEGTSTERWLQRTGTSTVVVIGRLVSWFVYIGTVLAAFLLLGVIRGDVFWDLATAWLPHLFVAVLILVTGIVVADKIEILVRERLQGIKLPEVSIIPAVVKYSIIFIASLIALGQIGIHTTALLIMLAVYFFGIVLFSAIALQDFLASAAAGIYLLLNEPISIGDEIRLEDAEGIVQEIDIFATRIEGEDREYIVPNRRLLRNGLSRVRD